MMKSRSQQVSPKILSILQVKENLKLLFKSLDWKYRFYVQIQLLQLQMGLSYVKQKI